MVSTDSFAATRCAAPLKRATTDWYYHIGKGTRLLISLSFCRRGREKKREREKTIGLSLSVLPQQASRFLPRFSTSTAFPELRLSVHFLPLTLDTFLLPPALSLSTSFSPAPFFISGSSDSRPRRFQSCFAEASTRPHLPPDFLRKLRNLLS